MTGLRGIDEYIEMDLVSVETKGEPTKYWAVVPNTADAMFMVDPAMINQDIEIKYLGPIQVQERE